MDPYQCNDSVGAGHWHVPSANRLIEATLKEPWKFVVLKIDLICNTPEDSVHPRHEIKITDLGSSLLV